MLSTKGYGFTPETIDWSSPADMKPYLKAHEEELKEKDYLAWIQGRYTLSAVSVAVEHCLAGRKAKSQYIKEPILSKIIANDKEITDKDIQMAIMTEQRYISMAINKGLPETIIT